MKKQLLRDLKVLSLVRLGPHLATFERVVMVIERKNIRRTIFEQERVSIEENR